MRTILKIVLTIVAFILATFLIGVLKDAGDSDSPGILGLTIGAGLVAGIIAIWKYNPDKGNQQNNIDKHQLDKS